MALVCRYTHRRFTRGFYIGIAGVLMISNVMGCKDALTNTSVPDGMQSPSTYLSRTGALALTRTAGRYFQDGFRDFVFYSGLLTDELGVNDTLQSLSYYTAIDARRLGGFIGGNQMEMWWRAHGLRGQARLARGVLTEYASDLSPAVRGQLYAFEGYAELWLADLFCSGVPLSTLDYNADFTYRPPSTTHAVYEHAVALFDSALTLVADSVNLQTLVAVGKGRALLALGRYEEAAAAVAAVAVNDKYNIRVQLVGQTSAGDYDKLWNVTVSDHEGSNGLNYRTSGDPRTKSDTVRLPSRGNVPIRNVYFPVKWALSSARRDYFTDVAIAGGVEAALIVAEAALARGQPGTWLSLLNTLRTTGTYSRIDTSTTGEIDTLWDAGSGGVTGLRPLEDPGDANLRVDLMFAERAAWLFLSGHRQGDLRRLVREYERSHRAVYPNGIFLTGEISGDRAYMSDVAFPIPSDEKLNPHYQGCLSYEN